MNGTDQQITTAFSSLSLPAALQGVIDELGFTEMTAIQAQSIPILFQGRDLVGQSKTGSGKTVAFALPILTSLSSANRRLQALVLCPTRELCTQVARDMRRLGSRLPGLQVLILSGGQPIRPQINSLEKGAHVAVGTPGRILEHLRRNTLSLQDLSWVVLDEADRMLDMGFQADMEEILSQAPSKRQTVFFSATFPHSIETMTHAFQKDPVLDKIEQTESTSPSIQEIFYEVPRDQKLSSILHLIKDLRPKTAMIFCNQKLTVAELAEALGQAGASVAAIHGDMLQQERDLVMAKFRNFSIRLLVATDVAARGIDISDMEVVVNYDLPKKPDVYVHRIGRTGRAGKHGLAISLIAPGEDYQLERIETFTDRQMRVEKLSVSKKSGDRGSSRDEVDFLMADMTTLEIAGGRKDKLRPGDILGALTGEAGGLDANDIGKIEIHDRLAYVAVSRKVGQIAVESLREGRIKGRRFQVTWHR